MEGLRRMPLYKGVAGYFPITLHKTAELPPDRRYLFAYHPHGAFSLGAVCGFGTDGAHVSKLFPGIRPHLLTLHSNFNWPIFRDYLMALGMASVSRESCETILRGKPGSAIVIVVGGAQESLSAHPGHMDLTLERRLGFIRVAMHTGYVHMWFADTARTLSQCLPLARTKFIFRWITTKTRCSSGGKCRQRSFLALPSPFCWAVAFSRASLAGCPTVARLTLSVRYYTQLHTHASRQTDPRQARSASLYRGSARSARGVCRSLEAVRLC